MVCTARFWNHLNDKKFCPVLIKLQALYTKRCIWDYPTRARHLRYIYQVQIDIIIYQIYQLVGGFSAKFVWSSVSQNIFFHTFGNKSFHFILWERGVSKTGLYLSDLFQSSLKNSNSNFINKKLSFFCLPTCTCTYYNYMYTCLYKVFYFLISFIFFS